MSKDSHRIWRRSIAAAVAALFALGTLASPGALAELPPRPDLPTTVPPQQTSTGTAGLLLHATYPADWPWTRVHWQTPLTVVQWQDQDGIWHDVEGWQGSPDLIIPGPSNTMVGLKAWGVAAKDFGTGPFRWLVYADSSRAKRLATSEPFTLPSHSGHRRTVEVTLEQP